MPNLATGADETNELVLVADDESGYFFVNGTAVGAFPLSARTEPGNISIAIELRGGQGFASGAPRYEGFQVRDLP